MNVIRRRNPGLVLATTVALRLVAGLLPSPACAQEDAAHALISKYETLAKDYAARALAELDRVEADKRTVARRFAGEVVGKPFVTTLSADELALPLRSAPGPGISSYGTNIISGRSQTSECSLQQPIALYPESLSDAELKTLIAAPATHSFPQANFDAWLAASYHADGLRQRRALVASLLGSFLDNAGERRRQLDNADSRFKAGLITNSMWDQLRRDALGGFRVEDTIIQQYLAVIDEYYDVIELSADEVLNSPGGGSPPGLACLIQSEVATAIFPLLTTLPSLQRTHKAFDNAGDYDKAKKVSEDIDALRDRCADKAVEVRDAVAPPLRAARDRFYSEREEVRQRMLAWRSQTAILGVDVLRFDAPAFYPDALEPNNVAAHVAWGAEIDIELWCFDFPDDARNAVRYPDLEPNEAFRLELTQTVRTSRERIISGIGGELRP